MVRAAVVLADAEGLEAVTIRAVARRLGTGVMSPVQLRAGQADAGLRMVEEVSGELGLPEPGGDWRADMHVLAGRSGRCCTAIRG